MARNNSKTKGSEVPAKASAGESPKPDETILFADTTYIPGWKCYLLIVMAAYWSPVSQALLSPTHGSIPAASYHTLLTNNILLFTIPLDIVFVQILPLKDKPFFLPVLAFSIPVIQHYLTPLTLQYGPAWSALIVEGLSYGLYVALTLNVTWQRFGRFLPADFPKIAKTFAAPLLASLLFYVFETKSHNHFNSLVGTSFVFSRVFTPLALAAGSAVLLPSKYLLLAAFPLLHTVFLNPHTPLPIPQARLNDTLAASNFTLLDRKESWTGYISVVQNDDLGFRVLRCDHSLLGGEWVFGVGQWPGGKGFTDRRSPIGEPVYAIFVMLEAIRLIEPVIDDTPAGLTGPIVPDDKAKALVIGLGIGTTPAALVAHGINTTVVEIDPVVYDFARDYFELPANLTGVIQDATVYVKHSEEKYDYIVHDVFTGGAEPAQLFTIEFIEGLRDLLKDDGIIAINYAADLKLPPASLITRTILTVFPNCRIYRDDQPKEESMVDFTNMVFFCRKTETPFGFRKAVEQDYLYTMARHHNLMPLFEVDPQIFDLSGDRDGIGKFLTNENVLVLDEWRATGAIGHWEVMRTVMPPVVWENW